MEHQTHDHLRGLPDPAMPGDFGGECHWDEAQIEPDMLAAVTGSHAPLLPDELSHRGEAILQRLRIPE